MNTNGRAKKKARIFLDTSIKEIYGITRRDRRQNLDIEKKLSLEKVSKFYIVAGWHILDS